MKLTLFAGLIALAASVACASIRTRTPQPAGACAVDPSLAGEWTDTRMTQLGPAWMKLSLRVDCRSTMRGQLLWIRITKHAPYRVADGKIVFGDDGGDTVWPFRLEGDTLYVEEFAGEHHVYRRVR
jgi:hypothetical protein